MHKNAKNRDFLGFCLRDFSREKKSHREATSEINQEYSAQNNLEAIQIISLAKNYHMSKNDPSLKIPKIKGPRNSYAGVLICVGGRGNEGDPYKSVEYLEGKFFDKIALAFRGLLLKTFESRRKL